MRLLPLAFLLCACGAPGAREPSAACPAGSSATLGACLPAGEREALCGPAALPAEGGCAPKPCASGVIDQESGVCLPVGSVRAIAEAMQIPLLADETLACNPNAKLVAGGSHAACIPFESACGSGARWETGAKKCVPERACPPGEAPFAGACVRVSRGPIVDVAAWARSIFGPDGGWGSSFLCGELAMAPWTFTPSTDVRFVVSLAIDLRIPDNDLTQTRTRIEARDGTAGQPLPVEPVQRVVDRLISGLRAMGGTARSSAISTRIRCALPVAARPMATPLPR